MAPSDPTGRNINSGNFPDLYHLLGLCPLESDLTHIELAIERMGIKTKSDGENKKSARLRALAKQHLLNAARKAAYDRKWQREFGTVTCGAPADAPTPDWQWNLLEQFLPKGDPEREFDLAAFIQHASGFSESPLSEQNLQADYEKLKTVISGNSSAKVIPLTAHATEARPETALPLDAAPIGSDVARTAPAVLATSTPKSIARTIRRKRERSLLFAAGGVLLSLAMVLGTLFVVLNWGKKRPPAEGTSVAVRTANEVIPDAAAPAATTPRSSGLPRVTGLDPQANVIPEIQPAGNPEQTDPGPASELVSPAPAEEPDATPTPLAAESLPASTNAEGMVEPPMPSAMAVRDLTEEEQAIWTQTVSEIRSLLGQQNYDESRKKFDDATALVKTNVQTEQLIRLKTVAALAEQFQQSLVEAVEGLSAGESIQVKSTQVSFVDGSATWISVRIRGQNMRFALTEIPMGLAWGLADLRLDMAHPSTFAKKASFAVFHPGSNELILTQAKELLASAVAEGAVPSDTLSIFEDEILP